MSQRIDTVYQCLSMFMSASAFHILSFAYKIQDENLMIKKEVKSVSQVHFDQITCREDRQRGARTNSKARKDRGRQIQGWWWRDERDKSWTWKRGRRETKVVMVGGWHETNLPCFLSAVHQFVIFCKYISHKFICPERVPAKRRKTKFKRH